MAGVVETENVQPGPGEHRWVCYVHYGRKSCEEVDVNARSKSQAEKLAREYAYVNLVKGWTSISVSGPKIGYYL